MNNPNWPWQGGDPSSSSSSQRYMPLALLTSYPAFQSSFNGGNIPGNNLAPLAAPMPGPGNHYLEMAGPSVPNTITNQNPAVFIYQPGFATVFNAPGYNNPHASVYQPGAPLYAQPGAAANNDPHTSAGMVPLPAYANQGASRGAVAGGGNLIPHASVNLPGAPLCPQPGSATDFSARDGNANSDPYTSAALIAPPASSNPGATRGPVAGVPNPLAQKNVPANQAALATNPETSEKLISMLNQDNHEFRVAVTRWVLEDVRMVMGSHTGHAVLLALLGAVERANMLGALEAIVNGAISPQYNGASLMEVANVSSGERALKEFVRLAALHFHPFVLWRLFRALIDGWKMEQSNSVDLLQHFFTTLPFNHCKIFIDDLAVPRFWDMVTSRFGYMSLIVCLENSKYTEQGTTLQNTVVAHIVKIANERYGSQLLRIVLERGGNAQLEERIRERVVQNLVELSMGRYGNNVVQECFVPRESSGKVPSAPLLQRGLDAFLRLPDEQLRELVQNHWAGYVFRRLLQTRKDPDMAKEEAMKLADRILEDETDAELPRPAGDDRREQAIAILQ